MRSDGGYAGICRVCDGWILLVMDIPETRKETAKDIARCIRDGYEVRRISIGEGRTMEMCPSECPGRKSQKTRDKQATLPLSGAT